jgi:hypothetical protein
VFAKLQARGPGRPWKLSPLAVLLLLAAAGCTTRPADPGPALERRGGEPEETLEPARETLAKSPDLAACRGALQQVNSYLLHHPDDRPPALTDTQRQFLQAPDKLGLSAAELSEAAADTYTLLDGQHLDQCLLFRDVARALNVDGLPQAKQAAAAFAWVVREVRLASWTPPPVPLMRALQAMLQERDVHAHELPPHLVVRRGWGTSLERGVVFVTLLEQLGIPGCLLATSENNGPGVVWGCGALVTRPDGGRDVLVFDPRLGLPLPGPGGQGSATLVQVRDQHDLLKPLTVDDKTPYDPTPEKIHDSEVFLVAPLSAVSPRIQHLQDRLLALKPPLHLAIDPAGRLAEWQKAGGGATVRFWSYGTRMLRQLLSSDEGGAGKGDVIRLLRWGQVLPWQAVPRRLLVDPGDQRFLGLEPQQRLLGVMAAPLDRFYFEGHRPPVAVGGRVKEDVQIAEVFDFHGTRDLILRGRYKDAVEELVQMRKQADDQKNQYKTAGDLDDRFDEWCDHVREAQGRLELTKADAAKGQATEAEVTAAKNRVTALYAREGQVAMLTLLGRAAEPLGNDVTYQLALCKQEQAEQLDARLERRRRAGEAVTEGEAGAAREAWEDAGIWWERYLDEYPQGPAAPAARRLRARVCERLGDRETAAGLLADLSGDLTGPEKVARLYLARQLKNKGD